MIDAPHTHTTHTHPQILKLKVACTHVPVQTQLSGSYKIHRSGLWNGRHVWVKDTSALIFYSTRNTWVAALRSPAYRIVATSSQPGSGPNPPTTGWNIPLTYAAQGMDGEAPVTLADVASVVGRWEVQGSGRKMVVAQSDDGYGLTYVEENAPETSYTVVYADEFPPGEEKGFVTAAFAVLGEGSPHVYAYLTLVDFNHMQILNNRDGTVTQAVASEHQTKEADEADVLSKEILKQLFGTHFTRPSVERVTGCRDQPVDGKTQVTKECKPDVAVKLTVRGQNFGKSGAEVYLLRGEKKEAVACTGVAHDTAAPSQMLTCTMPSMAANLALDVVVIATGSDAERHETVLYAAVKTTSGVKQKLRSMKFGNFIDLGVGGLGSEFEQLFRRAFASRLQDDATLKKLGIRHVRGVVLHGPPGTGKTLLARKIGDILGAAKVHKVSGPEILSKYVGQSESNLRDLFDEAMDEAAQDEGLHLIIFDEMDAIMKPRGGGDNSGAKALYDGVTTQLLTLMDGLEDKGNLLVMGLTNKLDTIDAALLRPGRFEVKIKMPLPDEEGRHEIFQILTKSQKEAGYLHADVDLRQMARDTPSYTGADIEGIIKSATSHALGEIVDAMESDPAAAAAAAVDDDAKISVRMVHFQKGLQEVSPSVGSSRSVSANLERGVLHYSEAHTKLLLKFDRPIHQIKHSKRNRMLRILVEGQQGSGLSTVASYVARRSGFPFVHLLSMEDFVGQSEGEEVEKLKEVFENAYLVEKSVIILDKLELILDHHNGKMAGTSLQHALQQLLTRKPSGKGKLLVLVTTNSMEALRFLGISNWDMHVTLPYLEKQDIEAVLTEMRVFENAEATASAVAQLPPRIGIKKLIWLVDQARVAFGVDEDVHTAALGTAPRLPVMKGRTQYVVPRDPPAEKEEEVLPFEELDIDEGWDMQV